MKPDPRLAIDEALLGRLVIVCGLGGVGKTTLSAALALTAAGRGRKTLVCTIDPSKRLRTSLGLARLTGRPQKVKGRLFAMRLDPKQTFDDLVRRHAGRLEHVGEFQARKLTALIGIEDLRFTACFFNRIFERGHAEGRIERVRQPPGKHAP